MRSDPFDMPYYISDEQPDCAGWAMVLKKDDGALETLGCHTSKQDAIDHMVAAAINTDGEAMGELDTRNEQRAVNLSPPDYMRNNARRGVELHEQGKSGDGIVPQTVEDARKMAAGTVTEAKWRKIAPWIARHLVDFDAVQGDEITPGVVAHLLWGSGATRSAARRTMEYAESVVAQLDAEQRADAPAPPKDQITGSDDNPAGSAADQGGDIDLSAATDEALQTKADDHNAAMAKDDKPAWTRVRVSALRAVWRRGAGAFSTSHRPGMTRAQWAMARVNAFLYLARTGAPKNPKYVGDNDLLHSSHPKHASSGTDRATTDAEDYMDDTERPELDVSDLRVLPDSYRPATTEGQSCGTCQYFDSERSYCNRYDAGCKADMVCESWEARGVASYDYDDDEEDNARHWVVAHGDKRSIAYSNLELRADGDGKTLVGYAAVFDSPSEPLPWTEFVRRGAFSKTINDRADVRLLIDHEGVPLARTKSGTLKLAEDDTGLRIEAALDDTNPDAAKLLSAMRRGDINQMSFAFETIKDAWSDDRRTRELREVRLYDVSVVTFPAYEQTMVALRNATAATDVANSTTPSIVKAPSLALRRAQLAIQRQRQAVQQPPRGTV